MNRLIIVGNGFDLAHGLKTSYEDFLLWLLKKSMLQERKEIKNHPLFNFINLEYKNTKDFQNIEKLAKLLETLKVNNISINGKKRIL